MKTSPLENIKISGVFQFVSIMKEPKLSRNNNYYCTVKVSHQLGGGEIFLMTVVCFGDNAFLFKNIKYDSFIHIEGTLRINIDEPSLDDAFTIMAGKILVISEPQVLLQRDKIEKKEMEYYKSGEFQSYQKKDLLNNFEGVLSGEFKLPYIVDEDPDYEDKIVFMEGLE